MVSIFSYTRRDWDSDIGLQYNRARWYDPSQGRSLSQDPIGFAAGDANSYRYAGNKPKIATDPSGLDDYPATIEEQEKWLELHPDHQLAGSMRKVIEIRKIREKPFIYGDPSRSGGVIEFSGEFVMQKLSIPKYVCAWGFAVTDAEGEYLIPGDYTRLREGCQGLNKLRLNSKDFVFNLPGT